LHTGLSPLILLSYRNKDHRVSYDLYMGSNGSTFIDRVEGIEISNNSNNAYQIKENYGKISANLLSLKLPILKHVSGEPTRIVIQKYSNASNIHFFYT
jgi:hypothetical protein